MAIDHFCAPTLHHHTTKDLFICHNFEETEQTSELGSDMAGILEYTMCEVLGTNPQDLDVILAIL